MVNCTPLPHQVFDPNPSAKTKAGSQPIRSVEFKRTIRVGHSLLHYSLSIWLGWLISDEVRLNEVVIQEDGASITNFEMKVVTNITLHCKKVILEVDIGRIYSSLFPRRANLSAGGKSPRRGETATSSGVGTTVVLGRVHGSHIVSRCSAPRGSAPLRLPPLVSAPGS